MKKKLRTAAITGLVATGIVGLTATPAFAINGVNFAECQWNHGQYLAFHDVPAGPQVWVCYANAGQMWIDQGPVGGFNAGNNSGWFEYEPGDGWLYRHTFNKWDKIDKKYGQVTTIHIN
ncbi:hypothetical protein E1263_17610 [Kribbella antibiotica]|uniref:Streptomyces killer toxin-like beta/gamma crystallin domain-containing protein n=1 Tax=Kribbella antibiotica TaxID=190195 RepID=A0A4R4ZJI9_9ACTN|nr:hypothetical protein [Kribbella antibiotica]TDD58803.1 hypothetical protein E1263_17610 [Kribbella antibiotica]